MFFVSICVLSCLLGCGYTSYQIGKRQGTTNAIEWLESMAGSKRTITMKFNDEDIEFLD